MLQVIRAGHAAASIARDRPAVGALIARPAVPLLSLAAVPAGPTVPDLVALLPAPDALAVKVAKREEPGPFRVAQSESEMEELSLQIFRSCLWVRSAVTRFPCCPPRVKRLVVAV